MGGGLAQELGEGCVVVGVMKDLGAAVASVESMVAIAANGGASSAWHGAIFGPWPYGGKQRQIMIDIDSRRLFAWGLSPRDVNTAIGLQNVIVPTGTAKIGADEYPIVINASPELLDQIGGIPIKVVHGTTVYVRDVANVRDGYSPQTNIVHVTGKKSVLMSILKQGSASTLDVVSRIRDALPTTLSRLPKG
jgi:multidrug efflux pump subunit AcrB